MRLRTPCVSLVAWIVLSLLPPVLQAQVVLPPETSPLNALKRLFCANFDGSDIFSQTVGGGPVVTPVSTNLVNGFLFEESHDLGISEQVEQMEEIAAADRVELVENLEVLVDDLK